MINIENDWQDFFNIETKKNYYKDLRQFLIKEYRENVVYPKPEDIFNAFRLTPINETKVVIMGQDCYHEPNQAMGLSFSVPNGTKIPPSLINIYKEIASDIGVENLYIDGDLTKWAKQGVLLLNTCLTVREHQANSHSGKGWEILTDEAIKVLNENDNPKVFMLWGSNARSKKIFITNSKHLVLESAHPSPLSAYRGFFGCKHFSKANKFLEENNLEPIKW